MEDKSLNQQEQQGQQEPEVKQTSDATTQASNPETISTHDAKINITGLTSKISELENELSKAKEELEAAKEAAKEADDKMLRAVAESQNVRRRAEIDISKAHQFGLEKFVQEIIPVVDTLEKAVESIVGESDKEGVDMILKMLVSTLEKFAVVQINPIGEAFNPEFHDAVSMVPQPDVAPNTVINVMSKGYSLNGRVLRPAMVAVSAN